MGFFLQNWSVRLTAHCTVEIWFTQACEMGFRHLAAESSSEFSVSDSHSQMSKLYVLLLVSRFGLPVCLSDCLSVRLYVCLSVCLSVNLPICTPGC